MVQYLAYVEEPWKTEFVISTIPALLLPVALWTLFFLIDSI